MIIMNREKENNELKEENKEQDTEETVQAEENEKSKTEEFEELDGIQIELSREELIEEVKEKNKKIEEMDAEIDDLLSRLQRLQADFVNYRKRSQREKAEMSARGKIKLCASLLPVIDNFERALKSEESESDFYKGVEMIYNQLLKTFADQGIEEILAKGEEFNPEYHEAIMRVESEEFEEGTVVEVVQKGFTLDDRVIRPAMVKVAG
ncbi:molecular chaperone GrpE [Halanaerobium sp. ST460_2HS_T2]|uniref:Protein GrpE n=2 Tax=Halanaerobiaceae TaxID=972 RepID=A0A1N6V2Y6_9FIRM|nr:molecular chaperone GrpE [Halanaerobium sp. ST460_2HS_T2]SIQ72211.1 molecular chaperone GrpE [Halanaerobium kushneri]